MSLEVIQPPTTEVLEKVRSEFGLSERRVREAIEHLRNWLELQPHLPKEIDDGRLERWLIRCKNSTEKVKHTLDMYYALKTNVPDVMTGWDTKGDWFKSITREVFCLPLPQLTPDYDRVVVIGLLTPDSTKFNMLHTIKLIQMISEIRISEDYCISDVYVFDYANVSLGHLPKITPSYLKKTETCAINGYNARIKAIHVLNAPPFTDALVTMFKSVLRSKLAKRMIVHGNDLTSFYEQVPKEILPNEYGGTSGSVAENWDLWKKKLQSYQHVFLERETYKSDESKRTGQPLTSSELLGFEGSFRKLDVD